MVGQALPLTTAGYHTSKGVHSTDGTFVLAGPQAAQANLVLQARGLASVPSLSPKPLSQHIPEAAKQTPSPMAHPSFPTPARLVQEGCLPCGHRHTSSVPGHVFAWWHGQW